MEKDMTVKELMDYIRSKENDFIIVVELGREEGSEDE